MALKYFEAVRLRSTYADTSIISADTDHGGRRTAPVGGCTGGKTQMSLGSRLKD
jgi:hypothetical protein